MLKSFKPTWMVESIYHITPEQLKKEGIKVILADLDNTLIAWNNPEATVETLEWIQLMNENNIRVMILSNNTRKRVGKVATILNLEFIHFAMKPFQRGFKKAYRKSQVEKEELLMVGDQILTDIKGANQAGIRSVLVRPILDSDAWNTKVNRFIELQIMNYLIKNDPNMKWRHSLNEPVE